MILEMERGFSGACPYVDLADVFASAFDLWHEGKKREAFDMFGRIQAFASITPVSSVDIMIARGVFKPGTKLRTAAPAAGAAEGAVVVPVAPGRAGYSCQSRKSARSSMRI